MFRNGIRIFTLLCAAFSIPYLVFTHTPPLSPADTTQPQSTQQVFRYTLGDYNGMLALFEGEESVPTETFSILTQSLPPAEADRIRRGIGANTREELQRLLEDYTS